MDTKMSEYKFGVIGAGNMAEAIVGGAVSSGVLKADDILVSDLSDVRRNIFTSKLSIKAIEDNRAAASCEVLMLAVKPQVIDAVMESVASDINKNTLIISIAAGVNSSRIDKKLGGRGRIVRVMPNTPMLAGAGMSALCAGPRAGEAELNLVQRIFSASGKAIIVTEDMMDAVTAVSGSGPAYFFYMIEAMIEAGAAEGLSRQDAAELAVQTCIGAGELVQKTGEDPAELRRKVTSPGGTTQRAIETMDSCDVRKSVITAVRAAAERSRELGG